MYGFDDGNTQSLLGAVSEQEAQAAQMQANQEFIQGLLGNTLIGEQGMKNLQKIMTNGKNAASQLGQTAQSQMPNAGAQAQMAQAQASAQQSAQQATAQQQQQQAQAGSLLGGIASMFIPGGGVLGFIKGLL